MKLPRKKPHSTRNPVYIFYIVVALVGLFISSLVANSPSIGVFEKSLFYLFYNFPLALSLVYLFVALFSVTISILVIIGGLLLYRRRDILLRVAISSSIAYTASFLLSIWVDKGRPAELLSSISPALNVGGPSFPSAFAAVIMAGGLNIAVCSPKIYRRWILYATFMFSSGGVFLGISTPVDIIGGWFVGLLSYSVALLLIGSLYKPVKASSLALKLAKSGLEDVDLEPASVDARGSIPFFGTYKEGLIFVKVFNQDNNAADWIFKIVRRILYKRLEDEVPSLSPKRAIEHEVYLTILAKHTAGVRTPEVVGIYRVGQNSYAMVQKRIDAVGLDDVPKAGVTDRVLDSVWKEIIKLHKHQIIHKDLRTANIMIDRKTGLPWIIDFGFSECAVSPTSNYKDNVEFIASSAAKVGAKRAVAAANRVIGPEELAKALPFMQYAALSGATTAELKSKPGLIEKLRSEIIKEAGIPKDRVYIAKLNRLPLPKLFN